MIAVIAMMITMAIAIAAATAIAMTVYSLSDSTASAVSKRSLNFAQSSTLLYASL